MADNTIAKAYVQLVPSARGFKQAIKTEIDPKGTGSEAGDGTAKSFGAKFKSVVGKLGLGLAIGKVFKDAFSEGSQLQQSMGGIKTLFDESSNDIIAKANEAWKSAGMSANEYMGLATSFSASLLQSLGGDTEKAAKITDMAITDMSDNANKMGTNMEDIKNAYQGFAKQNYVMLDNLKLGYGGTKSEMERLLADAQKITGVKYDINNLNDVYEAIHVIQDELGITGTTALEANETLEGSFKSLKASYQDFLGKLLIGEDIAQPMTNLATAVLNVAKNVLPAVTNLVSGLLPAITGALAQLAPQLPPMLVDFVIGALNGLATGLPQTFENITLIMTGLLDGIIAALPVLINALPNIITTLINALLGFIPQLVQCGVTLFTSLIDNLPLIIETIVLAIPQISTQIVTAILNNIPLIITAGVTLFVSLVKALPQIIAQIVSAVPQIIQGLKNTFLSYVSEFPSIGRNIIGAIGDGITNALTGLVETGIKACKKLAKSVKDFFGIKSPSRMFRDFGSFMMKGLAIGIEKTSSVPIQAMNRANQQILKDFDSNLSREIAFSSSFRGSNNKQFNGKTSPNITQTFIFNEPWKTPADTARALRSESIKLGLAGDSIG